MVLLNDLFFLFIVFLNVNLIIFWVSGNRWVVEGFIMNLGFDFFISNFGFIFFDKLIIDLFINFIGVEFLKIGSSIWSFIFVVIFGMWKFVNNVIFFFEVKVGLGVFGIDVFFNLNCRLLGIVVLYDVMLMLFFIVLFEIVIFVVMFNKLLVLVEGSNLSLIFRVVV